VADFGDLINNLNNAATQGQATQPSTPTPLGAPPSKLDPLISQLQQAATTELPKEQGPPGKAYYNEAGQPFTLEGGAMAAPPQQPPAPPRPAGTLPGPLGNLSIMGGIKALFDAAKAPGDVYSGQLATPYSGGSSEASPEVADRALQFATSFSPASAALRAGAAIPGEVAMPGGAPSVKQLKSAADAGYDAARASPVTVPAEDVASMAQNVKDTLLNQHGIIPETAPKAYSYLDRLANPPAPGPGEAVVGGYPGLEAARRGLSNLKNEGGTEGFAAQKAIPELDQFIDQISPDAATARANMAAAFRSNSLTGDLSRANTGILEQAEARSAASNSGHNIDNAIRQRVASLLQSPQNLGGFSQSEIDALNNVVQGGPVRNAARYVGNYLGGGGGIGGLAATYMGSILGGHLIAGPEGGALGATIPASIGISAKGLENALSRRSLNAVDEQVRARSPLGQATVGGAIPAMKTNSALLRAMLPSALAPPQQPYSPLAQTIAQGGSYPYR
jgi:hypothetical protein